MEEDEIKPNIRLLLIGGSAGSLEVLMQLLPKLKAALSFSIAIVLHRKSAEDQTLEDLIAVKTKMPVMEVEDKVALLPGHLYIAPSDYHLLFEKNGLVSLDISEKVNYSRPSLDVTFESAADAFGAQTAALLLSGANADGTAGLKAIKNTGGLVAVQNPETAEMPFMPQNAIQNITPNFILNVNEMVAFITSLGENQ